MISTFKLCRHQRLLFSAAAASTDHLHFRTETLADNHLRSLCNRSLYREALHAFHFLQSHRPNFHLQPGTYRLLFDACSHLKSPAHCRQVHRHLSQSSVGIDVVMYNHILTAYGKCGSLDDARELFEIMPKKNDVSWTALIAGYVRNSFEREAVGIYLDMRFSGIYPDQFVLGNVVGASSMLGDVELGEQLHGHMVKLNCASDRLVQNALVSMYAKGGRIDDAAVVFTRIVEKDMISWAAMTAGLAQQGHEFEALCCFRQFFRMGGHCLSEIIFRSVFHACGGLSRLDYGEQTHGLYLKFGWGGNAFAGCSLSSMYSKCGSLDSSRKAFYQIKNPDLVAWNSIISSFAESGDPDACLLLFSDMRSSGMKPDPITARHLLGGFTCPASLCQGQLVHSYIEKTGFDSDVAVSNTLLTMYTKCSDYFAVCHLFEEVRSNGDLISWNIFLTACLQHAQPNEALLLLKSIHNFGTRPDNITLNLVLRACAELTCLETVDQVHVYSSKVGLESDLLVTNGLIDAYAKCGNLDYARKVFEVMGDTCDVISWSSLITGYAQFGHAKEALELFNEMQRCGTKPNQVTFTAVLSACSRVGSIDEGCHYFETMETVHGIKPTKEHFSCMIDMFARAGQLTEAKRIVEQMPFEPDIVVWKTLLTACKQRGNVEVGEVATRGILKLDPSNSTAHALLCSIYASAGDWNGAARLRKIMNINNLKKDPGRSWIELKGEVHNFSVQDRSHPKTKEIYSLLRDLCFEMRETGHTPC